MVETLCLDGDESGIALAAQMLRDGALVAFPTETVYGLGADATDDRAVARIFQAKGRPHFNPLIVHVADTEAAFAIGRFGPAAQTLARTFWPGPLTLVVPLRPEAGIAPLVSAGLDTIAIRVPEAPLARRLLAATERPVAAPSANPSGRVSPTRAEHVMAGLAGRIEAVLDGGPCRVGLESTIIEAIDTARLLRPGGLPVEAIEACLGHELVSRAADAAINAPGQLQSHYAPRALMRLGAEAPEAGERYIGFGRDYPGEISLSSSGDLVEAAANLFHCLRKLDEAGEAPIAVAPIPETGLGRAINDRLRRAAAPRD